jgi:hypothetical protein
LSIETVEEKQNEASAVDCVTVSIPVNNFQICYIVNLGYNNKCTREGLLSPGGGDILLRFIVNYLLMNPEKYDIKRIVLKDQSYLQCANCSITVSLSRLRMITHGRTWYMKYGFRLYDNNKNELDDNAIAAFNTNLDRLNKYKLSKIPLENIIKFVKNNEKDKIDKAILNEVTNIATQHVLLAEFLNVLLKNFQRYCCVIAYILDFLYKKGLYATNPLFKPELFDFHGKHYFLNIKNYSGFFEYGTDPRVIFFYSK